eukprot:scaffold158524_cov32-Tisochrysis_lutea.AAC.2
MFSSSLIARVIASAVSRKACGDRGHPCGTPLACASPPAYGTDACASSYGEVGCNHLLWFDWRGARAR